MKAIWLNETYTEAELGVLDIPVPFMKRNKGKFFVYNTESAAISTKPFHFSGGKRARENPELYIKFIPLGKVNGEWMWKAYSPHYGSGEKIEYISFEERFSKAYINNRGHRFQL